MRINQLTFTRFIAAIGIVIFHFGKFVSPFNNSHLSFLFNHANLGVSYFFILSGFVMIIAYSKNKTKINATVYYINRLIRIYPLYLLALILALLFIKFSVFSVPGLLLHLFLLQAWFPQYALYCNLPAWSLSVEAFFYLIFPVILNQFYLKFSSKTIFITIVSIWLLSQILFAGLASTNLHIRESTLPNNFIYYFPLMHLNEFLIGNLGGLIYIATRKKNSMFNKDAAIFIFLALSALFGALLYKTIDLKYFFASALHNGLLAIFILPLILLLAMNNGYINKLFSLKPLEFLGEISYGIYILQFPVYALSTSAFKLLGSLNPTSVFFLSTATLILVSGICHLIIEVPLRKAFKRK